MQMLHFADNIAMIANSVDNLKRMLLKLDKSLKYDYNMKINMAKTKILNFSRQQLDTNITINNIIL